MKREFREKCGLHHHSSLGRRFLRVFWVASTLSAFIALLFAIMSCGKAPTEGPQSAEKQLKTIKVAVLLPETGPQAAIGRGAINSVRLAFDQAKPQLAARGSQVELVLLDDASKPETAVAQAQRATSDPQVVMAIAHFNSPCALATVGLFHDAHMPVIIPAAVNSKITVDRFPEVFRTCNTDLGQAEQLAKFLVETKGWKSVYALHDNSAFGKGLVDALDAEFKKRNIALLATDAFNVGDVDFSSVLARIEAQKPEAIVVGCMATEGALLRRQMVEKGMQTPLVGFSGIFYDTFLKNAGSAANGTMAIFPLPPLDSLEGGREYEKAYRDAGFREPYESAGPFGYVAGQVAVQTLLAGATDRASILGYLRSGKTFQTAFGPLTFDQRGEMSLQMYCIYEVRNDKWAMIYRITPDGKLVPANK